MTGYLGKHTNWADDVIGAKVEQGIRSQWGEIPGEIVAFNSQNQTATIRPLYKPKFNGEPVAMPDLLEVPVRFQRAGGGAITMPVKAGDKVTLRPQMRNTESYHSNGDGAPADNRAFNLSDMEAHLAGGESLSDPIPNFDSANMHIRANPDGTHGMKMTPDGKLKLATSEGDLMAMLEQSTRLQGEGFTKLGAEGLTNSTRYAEIGAELTALANKMAAVKMG